MTAPLLPVYHRSSLTMVRGEGAYLFDESDKPYLDFAAGIGVNSFGHCHPHLVKALQKQAKILWHCSNRFYTEPLTQLAERLVEHTFADTVFFTNSGLEAVETGIKMVRRYQYKQGYHDRYRIIAMDGGFHGRSMGALSACSYKPATEGFGPMLPGFDHVPFNDLAAVEQAITPQTAGILLEAIQGEGGVRVAQLDYLRGLRTLCDTYGLLLFFDEVQCGMARTGTLLAFEQAGITPDICTIAKGIGGGFPLGACLATHAAASGMTTGSHGGTYGGNPLATAVGNAVLDLMLSDGLLEHVQTTGMDLAKELSHLASSYPHIIGEVRGTGLMLGIKTVVKNTQVAEHLLQRGLIVAPAQDNVIRILPPLIITQAHVNEAVHILRQTCEAWV